MSDRAHFRSRIASNLFWLLAFKFILNPRPIESVFSSRPFKQRPTNSSRPLCFGRKTRRSHSVKFESVVLGQESQGQLWRTGGQCAYCFSGHLHSLSRAISFLYCAICLLGSMCTTTDVLAWLLWRCWRVSTGEKSCCFSPFSLIHKNNDGFRG